MDDESDITIGRILDIFDDSDTDFFYEIDYELCPVLSSYLYRKVILNCSVTPKESNTDVFSTAHLHSILRVKVTFTVSVLLFGIGTLMTTFTKQT